MEYRHTTPPNLTFLNAGDNEEFQCPGGSGSSNSTFFPQDWSPETVMTAATSPPKSPYRVRENGSRLLPKPRDQDQFVGSVDASESLSMATSMTTSVGGHSRTVSLPHDMLHTHFGGVLPPRPGLDRRSTSPPGYVQSISPASAPSPYAHLQPEAALAVRPSISNHRSVSTSNIRSHSRNSSTSSIDVVSRFGYPTYRQSPTPQPMGTTLAISRVPNAMNHLAPITMPGGMMQSYPNNRRTASPPAPPSRLSMEVELPDDDHLPKSTLIDYLTGPNPTPQLVQRITETARAQNTHFWFDIRNIRPWTDFQISTMHGHPKMMEFLQYPLGSSCFVNPTKINLHPEIPAHLAETIANYYAVKVNAALKVFLGEKHIALRAYTPAAGARQQPEFIARYQSDAEKTIYGDGRGRVVGIVKCWDQWNSGMRHGDATKQVEYLRHLAHLHRFMREHGTRYGFIMTETELVCVRMGGVPRADNIPYFGFLEIAQPVQIGTSGPDEGGNLRMTAGLALWYLHVLAKEQPLEGQYHWKLDVGGPQAMTRRVHLPRDDWMPKQNLQDKREAKRIRGWVFPDEPLHKRETGRTRKGRS